LLVGDAGIEHHGDRFEPPQGGCVQVGQGPQSLGLASTLDP
jgi:hypothetical protein